MLVKMRVLFNRIFELVEVGGELADEIIVPTVVVIKRLEFQLPRVVAVAEGGDGDLHQRPSWIERVAHHGALCHHSPMASIGRSTH